MASSSIFEARIVGLNDLRDGKRKVTEREVAKVKQNRRYLTCHRGTRRLVMSSIGKKPLDKTEIEQRVLRGWTGYSEQVKLVEHVGKQIH